MRPYTKLMLATLVMLLIAVILTNILLVPNLRDEARRCLQKVVEEYPPPIGIATVIECVRMAEPSEEYACTVYVRNNDGSENIVGIITPNDSCE